VQNVCGTQRDGGAFHSGGLVFAPLVAVVKLALLVPVHHHFVGHEGVECDDLALAVADDLGVGIALEEQVGYECFSEHKRTHLRVRLIVEQEVQRVVDGFLLSYVH